LSLSSENIVSKFAFKWANLYRYTAVYGRLYRRFEPAYYWWEVVYLVRRICLTVGLHTLTAVDP
jgi:hypothetical protein